MNKLFFLLLTMFAINYTYSQISIGFYRNIDFYKPYTSELQDYMKLNNQVESATMNAAILFPVIKSDKIQWNTGVSLKRISFLIKDRVTSYYELEHDGSGQYDLVNEKLDFKSKSLSLALQNEVQFLFPTKNKFSNAIGLSNEIYFLEFFNSDFYYSGTNTLYDNNYAYISPLVSKLPSNFFFSCANLSIFQRFTFKVSDKFSLATKISLGTNLYSDWDQFKKYAWLGVGLELGFGNKPLFRKKEK